MSYSYWKKQIELPPKTDIVIVGGGFIGLSVAYWLKRKKSQLDICILDSQELGEGASGRNAGFLTKGSLTFYQHLTAAWGRSRAEDIYHFADESIQLVLEHFALEECFPTSSYTLYSEAKEFEFKGFQKVSPLFKGILESYESLGEASINPMILLKTLEEAVKSEGVKILRGVECLNISGKIIETNRGEIRADEIVIALNGYTDSLISDLVIPQRAQMLCVELKEPFENKSLIYEPDSRVYFKSIGNKKLIIGGKRLVDPEAEETSLLGINHKIQQSLQDYILMRIGQIESVHARWSGIMGFSADELPLIEKRDNYFLITGFSGHGMGFGFNASRNLSDMIIDNKPSFFHSIRNNSLQSE